MLAPILAFAGVAAVQAGPLYQRQVSSVVSSAVSGAVSSAVSAPSSIASEASSAVESATSAASSAVESATSAASSGVESASSAASSATSSAAAITAAPSNATTGNQSFPLYPCPTGYLLTYVEVNQTVPVPVTQATEQFGEWANSTYFPNTTASMGGNDVGATHTINLQGTELIETLVNATMNSSSGYAMWTWNLTNGPASAMGVSLSNYSTVLSIYDPTYDQTGTIGNETTLLTYTNFCASSQAEGMTLVSALANLELGSFAARLGGSAAGGAPSSAMSSAMMATSSAASSAMMATSSAASSAAEATSSVASSAAEATSSAASAAESGASAASSGASAATSSIASEASSAVSAALPSSTA